MLPASQFELVPSSAVTNHGSFGITLLMNRRKPCGEWSPFTHPEGVLYHFAIIGFRFSTDANIYEGEIFTELLAFTKHIRHRLSVLGRAEEIGIYSGWRSISSRPIFQEGQNHSHTLVSHELCMLLEGFS